MVIGQDVLKKEKEWTKFPNLLSKDETKLIEDLDWLVSEYSASALTEIYVTIDKKGDIPQPPAKRLEKAFDKKELLLKQQLKTFASLRERTIHQNNLHYNRIMKISCYMVGKRAR